MKFLIRKLADDLDMPQYMSKHAAGLDLRANIIGEVTIKPMQRLLVPCGFAMALPVGYEAQVRPRSGLALNHCITVLNSPGTIDADYRGEICVILINFGEQDFIIRRNDRIAQMVVSPVSQVDFEIVNELPDTARGSGGFGSTN
jgi:dUTP pyrophosphatase